MATEKLIKALPDRPKYEHDQQLLTLYTKWVDNPVEYNTQMAQTVERIIRWVLARKPDRAIYYRIEDQDDLLQDLKTICFRKLQTVENPTNKRIFNRLRLAVLYGLKDRARKLSKYMDREEIENMLCNPLKPDPLPDFGEESLNILADYLSSGYGKRKICKELEISPKIYEQMVDQLRQYYQES